MRGDAAATNFGSMMTNTPRRDRVARRKAATAVLVRAAVAAVAFGGVPAAAPRDARAVLAFPGATGFGANAAGGRGGDVYHVTTLADDPTHSIRGSLFYGVYDK